MPTAATLYRAPMLPGNDVGNASSETQFPDGRGKPLKLQLPSNGSLANKPFRVRVGGRISTTTDITATITVYFGLDSTVSNNTQIFSATNVEVNATTTSWEMWLDCFWSADANAITGRGAGQLANSVLGPAPLSNIPLPADPNRDSNTFLASGSSYGFTATISFSSSSAGNHAIVDTFDLESV